MRSLVAGPRQVERGQDAQRVGKTLIGQLVPDPAAFGCGGHQPALTQAGQVIGQVGAAGADVIGHLRRLAGTADQVHENTAPRGVRQRRSHPGQDAQINHLH